MHEWTKHLDTELAKLGLKLTEDGRRFYEVFVLCGKEVSVPNHFLENIN